MALKIIADRQRTAQIDKRASKHETENEKKTNFIYHTLFLAKRHSHHK